jgi:trimethylamine--corrinoid protein Co-methyltransferase
MMRLTPVLNHDQCAHIHRAALRVLSEVGVQVEHPAVRERLCAAGAHGLAGAERVTFDAAMVERHIADAPKTPPALQAPRIGLHTGVYQSLYLDPDSGQYRPYDEASLADFLAVARQLPLMGSVHLLGVPFVPAGLPPTHLPLAERLYAWMHGVRPDGSVHLSALCQPILDLYQCHADATGQTLSAVFNATGYLISPLKLGRPECEQVEFFYARGLRMGVGHMVSQGGTTPVTLAGTLVLTLAEEIFLFLLRNAYWPGEPFRLGASAPTIDMRQAITVFGRPEMQRANIAYIDLARFYGCACSGHAGLTDARVPSCEAGAQKATGALITALATGNASIEAGLMGIDEVLSPVQAVLDCDIARSLNALLAEMAFDEQAVNDACAEIIAAGIGGNHLGTDYTAERHRRELFQPFTWSYQNHPGWSSSGQRTDVDHAREMYHDLLQRQPPQRHIGEDEERALRAIIQRAAATIRV